MIGNRTLRRSLAIIVMTLALFAGSEAATAAEEQWRCCVGMSCLPNRAELVATLTVNRTNNTGTINIDNIIVEETAFAIDGLDRVWSWKDDHDKAHLFTITTHRYAYYYSNWSETEEEWESRNLFVCQKR